MKAIKAQIKKDWLTLWPLFAILWLLLLMASSNQTIIHPKLISVLTQVMIITVCGLMLLQDQLTSSNAFLRTQPFGRITLSLYRLLAIVLAVFIPTIGVQSLGMLDFELSDAHFVEALVQSVFWLLSIISLGCLAALITSSLRIWIVIILFVSPVLVFLLAYVYNTLFNLGLQLAVQSTLILLGRTCILMTTIIIIFTLFWQYRSSGYKSCQRICAYSMLLLASGFVLLNINKLPNPTKYLNQGEGLLIDHSLLTLNKRTDTGVMSVSSPPQQPQNWCSDRNYLQPELTYIKIDNTNPAAEYHFTSMKALWLLNDGSQITKHYDQLDLLTRNRSHNSFDLKQVAIGMSKPQTYRYHGFDLTSSLTDVQRSRLTQQSAQVIFTVKYWISYHQIDTVIPVVESNKTSNGIVLSQILHTQADSEEIELIYERESFEFIPQHGVYLNHSEVLLRNPQELEVLSLSGGAETITLTYNTSHLILPRPAVKGLRHRIKRPQTDIRSWFNNLKPSPSLYSVAKMPLSDEWIDRSELIIISNHYAGHFTQTIKQGNFSFENNQKTAGVQHDVREPS